MQLIGCCSPFFYLDYKLDRISCCMIKLDRILCNLTHKAALCTDLLGLLDTAKITFEILSNVISFFIVLVFNYISKVIH